MADRRSARFHWWPAIALALLSALPVIVAHYPQMSDYPAHLARYHVMIDAGMPACARDPFLALYYGFRWAWTGNVGVDLLIGPLAALFGLEPAGRIITALIPPLTGLGLLAVEWALRRRVTAAAILAFAFIWSPMMLIGLLNFTLGQTLALWAFALWVVLAGRRWRWALFVLVGLVVWLCHLSAWVMLGALVLGYEWARRHGPGVARAGDRWRAVLAPWPLLAPIVPMAMSAGGAAGTNGAFTYGAYWWVYKQAIWLKAMRDSSFALDYLSLVVVGAVLLVAFVARRIDPRLGWAALILLAGAVVVPRHISGGDYADYRLVTSGLMVACLAVDWPAGVRARWAGMAAAAGLYLLRLAVTATAWHADSSQTARLLGALDHIPRGAVVASAVVVSPEAWPLDHFEHIGDYAVVRRDALTNGNFAVPHVHMLHLKTRGSDFADPSQRLLQRASQPVDLARFAPAQQADWLWYVGPAEPASLPAGATVVWRAPGALLARLAKRETGG